MSCNTTSKYTFYIGANNDTGKLEQDKALDIIADAVNSFTYWIANGVWRGTAEKTLVVEILTDADIDNYSGKVTMGVYEAMVDLAEQLRKELEQQAVMFTERTLDVTNVSAK